MKDLLDELRAQRALIRRHLDWLEAKIYSLENEAEDPGETPPPIIEETEPAAAPDAPTEEPSAPLPESPDAYRAPNSNQLMQAKMGCLVIFATGTLLFLFLLFGLPYLLD